MIHTDLSALALFTAGAIAVIKQIEVEDRQLQEQFDREYSLWEEKVARLARGKGVGIVEGPGSVELGLRLGRTSVQALGLLDPNLASEIGLAD